MKSSRTFSILLICLLTLIIACENGNDPKSGSGGETLAPLISLPDGAYAGSQTVFMQAQQDAEIFFTLDGTDPSTNSANYSNPLTIDSSLTLKAIAVLDGSDASSISIRQYEITSSGASVSETPVISQESGTYTESPSVTISAASGAAIYYTINGSKPTSDSIEYNGGISIPSSLILRTVAIEPGKSVSAEAAAVYTITGTLTPPAITPFEGTYVSDQTVALFSDQGAEIRYTTNGTEPTSSSPIYTGPFTVDSSSVVRAICLKTGWTPSLESAAQYTITGRLSAPVATPAAGTYPEPQTVTLTASSGASIYYTTDGSAPTTGSTPYTAPVQIDRSVILRAIAIQDGWADSETIWEPYQIQDRLYPPQISPAGGQFTGNEEITITAATGTDIYYTLDGTYPDRNSLLYAGPFTITETCEIQAIAVKSGLLDSEACVKEVFYAGYSPETDFTTASDGVGGVIITDYTGGDRTVIVPPEIGGLPVTEIGNEAFRENATVTSIRLPGSITTIGDSAFLSCYALKTINIPESITVIGARSFSNCPGLTSIIIPEGITRIEANTFAACSGLTSIILPEGITNIEQYAFSGCSGLTSIIIPDSITNIEYRAFYGCSGLTSIKIPEGVTNIVDYTFSECRGLTSIIIPESITNISDGAFYRCSGLKSIIIPENVTDLEYYAFSGCTSLSSIIIPGGITSIKGGLFFGCTGLISISIPEGITTIEQDSFSGCTQLSTITLNPTTAPTLGATPFTGVTDCTLRYPAGAAGYDVEPWTDTDIFSTVETF